MNFLTQLDRITAKSLLLWMGAASAAVLGAALAGQYGLGWHPCELCLYQRYPYIAIIVLAPIGAYAMKSPRTQWAAGLACVALFLLDALLAGYHTGVEFGWFPAPSTCSSSASGGQTLEEMRAAIMGAPLVPCNQAMAQLFGLSLAVWNAVIALSLSIAGFFCLSYLRRSGKA